MEYKIIHRDGQTTYMSCDLMQAAAPIRAGFDHGSEYGPEYDLTPYQTADAHHRLAEAAALVLHYTDRECCGEDDDHACDCAERIERIERLRQ